MFLQTFLQDSDQKIKYSFGASLTTGIISLGLNLLSFGIAGSIFGIVSTLAFAAGCYYKGQKVDSEKSDHNYENDSLKANVSGALTITAVVASHFINLFTFGIGGTAFDLIITAGLGAYSYYKGKLSSEAEAGVAKSPAIS